MAFKHISIAQTLELLDKEDVVIADIRDLIRIRQGTFLALKRFQMQISPNL